MTKRRRLSASLLLPLFILTLQPCLGLPAGGMLARAPRRFAAAQTTPPNDNFADALTLTGNAGSTSGTNVAATKETGEPNHAGVAGGASVWYRWQAPSPGTLTLTTAGSNFNTTLAVYTGTAVNALTSVGSNDDVSGTDHTSSVAFAVTAGTTYGIAVDGSNGATGNVTLNWSFTSSCTYRFNPSTGDAFSADATIRSVTVITQNGCPWTAASNSSFLTITSGASGTGQGFVS